MGMAANWPERPAPPEDRGYVPRRPLRERVCGNKARLTYTAAMRSTERARAEGERMSPYPCPFCGWWHLGHTPPMETLREIAAMMRERYDA